MSKLRVHSFSVSIDGFGAGPGQDIENPLGVGGLKLRTLTQPLPKGEETWCGKSHHSVSFAPSPNLSQRERRAGGTDKSAPGSGCTAMTMVPDT